MTGEVVEGDLAFTTKRSAQSVAATVAILTDLIAERQMRLFAVIDQREEAAHIGLELRETTLVIFGNPAAGTAVMVASPLAALDLPLKVLIWAEGQQTTISYLSPDALASRYHLSPELAANLRGIDALTDALVAATH